MKKNIKKTSIVESFEKSGTSKFETEQVKLSRPIIVRARNTTDSVVDISLFGTAKNLENIDNWKKEGIFIESAIPGISYNQILYDFIENPFEVGKTHISIIGGNKLKVYKYTSVIQIHTEASNGNNASCAEPFLLDPLQFQDHVFVSKARYFLDAGTEIKFKLPYESEIIFAVYPIFKKRYLKSKL